MRLLVPTALWWLLTGAIIVLFYLLKLKRKRAIVPSIILWRRAVEELEASAPFKKLRRSLLLILQLLALAALVFALARPQITTRALASGNTIIVIDSTASMGARDEGGRSRLEHAKQLAREMVDGLSGSDRAAIIESSSRVTIRSPLTSDRALLASAIGDVQQTDAPGTLAEAVRLAEQIGVAEGDASAIVISDGGGSASDHLASASQASSGVGMRFVRVGSRSDNVGIIALNSRRLSGGNRRELFASIANFGDHARGVGAELRIDGRLVDARTIELAANDRRGLVFNSLPREGGLAQLKLDADDDLASDNVAYAFLPGARRVRVGVASENPFLLNAVAVNSDIEARKLTPGSGGILPADSEFDCIVSERTGVAGAIESKRPLLVIDPPDATGLWRATGQLERPEITSVDRSHPVNGFLSYADLHVERVSRREAASWLKPIVSAGGDALIWAGEDGRRRMVVIGFDLTRTDLPLKIEFPILLANSISWLSGEESPSTQRAVRAGQPVTIHPSTASARITTPAGDTREVEARDGAVVFADTFQVGAYEVKNASQFAVSLLSESESNTAPRDSIMARVGQAERTQEPFSTERDAWRWIALLGLIVLTTEWWAYHRRIA